MENAKIKNMYDLSQSIAGEYLSQFTYPWEALKGISDFIKKLGPTLDPEIYEKRGENIWVAKSATVAPTACLNGPLITITSGIPFSVTSPIWEPVQLPPM